MTTGFSRMVRARSLPSISSWSHAATYQQFMRKACVSGPIAAFLEALGGCRFQKFYDVRGRKFGRHQPALGMKAAEGLSPRKILGRRGARRALHLGVDHPRLVAEDRDVPVELGGDGHAGHPQP